MRSPDFPGERRDGDIHHQGAPAAIAQGELIETGDALFLGARGNFRHQVGGQNLFDGASDGFGARDTQSALELGVPELDAALEVHSQNADVQGLDDIFGEVFQALDLRAFCSSEE